MKVKLLQNLPDLNAGAIFDYDPKTDLFSHAYKIRFQDQTMSFSREMVGNNPLWFEEVKGGETK